MGRELEKLARAAPLQLPAHDEKHPAHEAVLLTRDVGGHETGVLLQPYDDRVFVCITQNDRLGTMISAEVETAAGGSSTVSVNVLMGRRDEMVMELVARRILAAMTKDGCTKPLLLSMALRSHDLSAVDELVAAVVDNKVW